MINAPPPPDQRGPSLELPADDAFQETYPTVWEYMTSPTYGDGRPRDLSALVVFVKDGAFKGNLTDRSGQRALWAASGSFLGLLEALEAGLNVNPVQWRYDAKGGGTTRRKPVS